jgi:hypothetical protein
MQRLKVQSSLCRAERAFLKKIASALKLFSIDIAVLSRKLPDPEDAKRTGRDQPLAAKI